MHLSEFLNLKISRIITHEIYQKKEESEKQEPFLNSSLTEFDQEALPILEQRIIDAIGAGSKSVEMDIANKNSESVYDFVMNIFGDQSNEEVFIQKSQKITTRLSDSQMAKNLPGGIVVVIDGICGISAIPFVIIIKAELQNGFRKSAKNTIEYVKDLLLTPQQKLYKMGAFIRQPDTVKAFVYDYNMSKTDESGLAAYFYDAFLGLKMLHTDKHYTALFYNGTRQFINDNSNFDVEKKYDLNTGLYAYLKSDALQTISIQDFANNYIGDPKERDNYSQFMEENVFPDWHARSINKDLSNIKSKLKMRKMSFGENIRLSGPSDIFEQKVHILEENTGAETGEISTILKIDSLIYGFEK